MFRGNQTRLIYIRIGKAKKAVGNEGAKEGNRQPLQRHSCQGMVPASFCIETLNCIVAGIVRDSSTVRRWPRGQGIRKPVR